jgi:glycerol-3-phosphate dehydrogenase
VLALAERFGVEMPIASGVAGVLFEGLSPSEAIHALMTRRLGAE